MVDRPWRTIPSPVHQANSISAINFGFTHVTSFALRDAPLPVNGLLSDESATSFLRSPLELFLLKPVPIRPVWTSSLLKKLARAKGW